jgi:hypothetical protein
MLVFGKLKWVVFGCRHLLESRGVHDVVYAVEGPHQPVAITDVTKEKPHVGGLRVIEEFLLKLVLLELVTGKDHHTTRPVMVEEREEQTLAERAGASRDENACVGDSWAGIHRIAAEESDIRRR